MTRGRLALLMAGLGAVGVALLAAAAVCATSGCSTLGYYAQSASSHLALVRAAKPVPEWLADPQTPPALKARLELSQRIRDFAVSELKEPDNASYRRYADLQRNALRRPSNSAYSRRAASEPCSASQRAPPSRSTAVAKDSLKGVSFCT